MRKEDQWNKQGEHCIDGEGSCQIEAYKLPSTDQDRERRNFPGYVKSNPGEALMEEVCKEGTRGNKINYSQDHGTKFGRRFA